MSKFVKETITKASGFVMMIGDRANLSNEQAYNSSVAWRVGVARANPNGFFAINIHRYDDDPRELWEIAQVARFVRVWARFAGMKDMQVTEKMFRSNPISAKLKSYEVLVGCGVFGPACVKVMT